MPTHTLLTLKLPEGYTFADLKLRRCESDAIDLDMDLVKLICKINALDFDKVLQNPGPVATSILTIWYKSQPSKSNVKPGESSGPATQRELSFH